MKRLVLRFGRYYTIRVAVKLIDLIVYGLIIWHYGYNTRSVLYAFVIAGIFDCFVDFWAQHTWVFRRHDQSKVWQHFVRYVFVRLFIGGIVASVFAYIRMYLEVGLTLSISITVFVVWPIVFWLYHRYVFQKEAT